GINQTRPPVAASATSMNQRGERYRIEVLLPEKPTRKNVLALSVPVEWVQSATRLLPAHAEALPEQETKKQDCERQSSDYCNNTRPPARKNWFGNLWRAGIHITRPERRICIWVRTLGQALCDVLGPLRLPAVGLVTQGSIALAELAQLLFFA